MNDEKMSMAVERAVKNVRAAGERYTKFLKMYLPGENNFYRVDEDQNQNFEKIDGALENAQRMAIDLFSKKQDKNDDGLLTESKNVIGAINELKEKPSWNNENCPILKEKNGYQKMDSGLIIQWGFLKNVTSSPLIFPIAFTNTNYSLVMMNQVYEYAGATETREYTYNTPRTTHSTWVECSLRGDVWKSDVQWIAIGY